MSSAPHAPAPAETTAPGLDDDARFYRHLLHDLLELGAEHARITLDQAKTEAARQAEPGAPQPSAAELTAPALSYERIARAMRRTILLAQKLRDAPAPATSPKQQVAARKRIIRDVEDAIQREAQSPRADTLHREMLDRLDTPEFADDLETQPIAAIVADICRDLGLAAPPGAHPWKRRTPKDLAQLCQQAARPFTLIQNEPAKPQHHPPPPKP